MRIQQTVLLVDDDPHLLAALQRTLHFEPYNILLAESATAALKLLGSISVDVLVTDHEMPGMSGAAFLTAVRREYPHVISIMLTGHADLSMAITAINTGEVYRFFTKPCEAGVLAAAIRHALQMKALIRQSRLLLETVRRQGAALAVPVMAEVDEPAHELSTPVFEVDDSAIDLDALLRDIQAELDAADGRQGT